jgi:subtilisin family serine protease/PKD repeat protein
MKRVIILSLFITIFLSLKTQNVYEWYQDGVLIFQLDTESNYRIPSKQYYVNLEEVAFLQDKINKYGITDISRILYYHPDEKLKNTYQINFTNIQLIDDFVKDLSKYAFIEYAEKKELHFKQLTPNDLGANTETGTGMWHLYKMQAQQAWDLSTGSANVIVAVVDDAIKTTHPDLAGKFVAGNDASDQNSTDPNPCGGNDGNHGTHVSGTVGANTNNGTGVSSIGFNVSIMPVKIGRCSDGALTAGYEGLAWAANNGANVINMSWGGGGTSTFGQNTATAAYNQGAILVAAAGNDGNTSLLYPAAYNNVIAVASTTNSDTRSSFSQYGTWINISAPGSNIRSTVATGNTYDRYNGTSMASPNVSGLLGLMKSYAPNATRTDLINCLYSSASPVSGNTGQMGAGRINAFAALQCLTAFALQTDAGITAISSPPTTVCGNSFTPNVTLRNFGSNPINSVTINYTWGAVNANFNWTGTLSSGQNIVINLPLQSSAGSGSFTFTATANLSGDQNAANNAFSLPFLIDPNGQIANLNLTTDCFGSEITWQILNSTNQVVTSGGPYLDVTSGQAQNSSFCLPVGCYTFIINDSYGDGLYGSQWGSCAVNGNYNMTASNGSTLFQMTAVNGNFGNTTSHTFCITDPNVNNDAGISEIISPSGILCTGTFIPQVRLRNYGNNNLTSATINYNVGGANQTFNWTGNLSLNQTAVVTLANITGNGNITFTAFTSLPNGVADQNNLNNQSQSSLNIFSTGLNLPFTESFNSTSISSGTWSLSNPDNDITWQMVTVVGTTPGTTGAKMDFFNYAQSSQRDGLISPLLNFNGYTSINMTFEHAYRRFNQTTTDSLIIYVSTNCGSTWQRVFGTGEDATGSFATAATNTAAFNPANSNEWCMGTVGSSCFSINLTAFTGNNVLVKFEGFNSGTVGNNLYLDNINITGVAAPITANFVGNPVAVCPGSSISFTDQSTGSISSRAWSFPGGTPTSSSALNPSVTYNTTGVYNVILTVNGPSGTDVETKTNYITVYAKPTVSISGNANLCLGGSTTLTANASAGSGSITAYQWFRSGTATGGNTATLNATIAGNYTVIVTNSNSCSTTSSIFTLNSVALPTVALSGASASFCQGSSVLLTANATTPGGSITSYAWSRNGSVLNGLIASTIQASQTGNYTVTVTNSFGCSAVSNTFNIASVIDTPLATISGNVVLCANSSGVLNANVTSSTGISSYQWKRNGANIGTNSSSLTITQAGTYTLSLVNSLGCSGATAAFVVTQTNPFSVDVVPSNASCGNSDGSATASINGSTSGYTFSWENNPGVNAPSTSALSAGFYELTVTQNSSFCVQVVSFIIQNAGAPSITNLALTQATCLNGNVGAAVATVSGGTGAYTYNWGTGLANTSSVANLAPGNYVLEVTDASFCQATASFTINNAQAPILDAAVVTNATCAGLADGAIDITVSGGSGNYSYLWNTGNQNEDLNNLNAGNYSVIITDLDNSCSNTNQILVPNAYFLDVDLGIADNSANQNPSNVLATPIAGAAPFTFSWNNGALSGDFIDNLSAGIYVLTLTDANGCQSVDTATIGSIGIRDVASILALQLYPNPSSEFVFLSLNLRNPENMNLSMFNNIGQVVFNKDYPDFKEGEIKLTTRGLAAGTYFVKVKLESGFKILPFVKID